MLEGGNGCELSRIELLQPTTRDVLDRQWVLVVVFLTSGKMTDHEASFREPCQMLGKGLSAVGNVDAQFGKGLPVCGVKPIQNRASSGVCQGFEYEVHGANNMQPNGCISINATSVPEDFVDHTFQGFTGTETLQVVDEALEISRRPILAGPGRMGGHHHVWQAPQLAVFG